MAGVFGARSTAPAGRPRRAAAPAARPRPPPAARTNTGSSCRVMTDRWYSTGNWWVAFSSSSARSRSPSMPSLCHRPGAASPPQSVTVRSGSGRAANPGSRRRRRRPRGSRKMTFSALPSARRRALHLHRDDDVHPLGHGRELPAGHDVRHAAGDRALVVVGRARHPVRQHVALLGQRQPHAHVAGALAGQRQRIEAGVQRCRSGTGPWPGSAARPATGVASGGNGEAILDLGHGVRHLHRTHQRRQRGDGRAQRRRAGHAPDRTRGHPAQPLGQRERPARRRASAG